jgi:hypothetical protein
MGRFEPGNLAALKTGARSQQMRQRTRQEDGERIRSQLLERWPHLEQQGFMFDLLVDALCDVLHLRRVIDDHGGPVSPRGHVYRAMEEKRAREHDAFAYASALVIPPRDLAKLGKAAGIVQNPRQLKAVEAHRALLELGTDDEERAS